MKIYNLKRFSKPEFLRRIEPKRLLAFLRKFPQVEAAVNDRKIDYESLAEQLASPEPGADTGIFDALAMIDAVSNDGNFDLLRRLTENKSYAGKLGDDVTVADLALTIWLHEPELLENVLNRHDRSYPRSFIYFRGLLVPRRYFVPPKPSLLQRLTRSLNKVFQRKKRGRNIKVTVLDELEEYQFMIRKGEPYSRDSAIRENGASGSVYYRPERFDLVVLRPNIAELRLAIHRKAPWLIEAYRTLFGYVFYGEQEYFSSEDVFTLNPLLTEGADTLVCRDVPGIDEVTIVQLKFRTQHGEIYAFHGPGGLGMLKNLKNDVLNNGKIVSAKFKVRLASSTTDRMVTVKDGNMAEFNRHGGTEFTISTIYRMLNNPIYIGKVKHNGKSYPGEHEAIIDRQLWNMVRKLMKENTPVMAGGHRDSITSPFKGLLRCGHCGGSFGISYAGKKKKSGNRRYMYYLCIKDEARAERRCPLARIPVGDINQVILEQMARLLKTPSMLAMVYSQLQMYEKQKRDAIKKHQKELEVKQESIRKQILNGGDPSVLMVQFNEIDEKLERLKEQAKKLNVPQILPDLLKASDSMEAIWEELFPVERYRLTHLLFEKIQIFTDHMVIDVKTEGLKSLIKELEADDSVTVSTSGEGGNGKTVQLTVPLVIRRRHGRKVIISPEGGQKANPKVEERGLSALALHLARAHAWMELIDSGKVASITELARKIDLDKTCVIRDLHLLSLAPDIQKMVAEGREPETLSLAKLREPFPDDWETQRNKFLDNLSIS